MKQDASASASREWQSWLDERVVSLERTQLLRSLRPIVPTQNPMRVILPRETLDSWIRGECSLGDCSVPSGAPAPEDGHVVRLFSANDYLGLSAHPWVREAASRAALAVGNGPRASALVSGYTHEHRALETTLAELKGSEECLLFPTGFAANLSVLTALASQEDCDVFSDELNHASIVDGARQAARGRVHVYRHSDVPHLEQLLLRSTARRKLVVTDTLFSMDGDFAPLRELAALRKRHGFLLAVDDAHGTLACGASGGGAAEQLGVGHEDIDVHVGTLSKAVGALGGFVCCSRGLKHLLVTTGRSQVYSTALPVPVVCSAQAAIAAAAAEPQLRERLWAHVRALGELTGERVESHIAAFVVGSEADALDASIRLLQKGFHVPAIRPPTVPKGTSRLRVALSAAHTSQDIADLASALIECKVVGKGAPASGPPSSSRGARVVAEAGAITSKL